MLGVDKTKKNRDEQTQKIRILMLYHDPYNRTKTIQQGFHFILSHFSLQQRHHLILSYFSIVHLTQVNL